MVTRGDGAIMTYVLCPAQDLTIIAAKHSESRRYAN